MIDDKTVFDKPINSNLKTYKNIRRIAAGRGDHYTAGCLLDYSYFTKNYKLVGTDLSKQEVLDADPRTIQKINFRAKLYRAENKTMSFIIEEAKETVPDISQGRVKVL